jgi:hypothetical protein
MKTILRALALSLIVTGAVASTHIAGSSHATIGTRVAADWPVAVCPPDDPNGCQGSTN